MATQSLAGVVLQGGLNTLQAGALRIPCLLTQCVTVITVGELALRAIQATLQTIGFSGQLPQVVKGWVAYLPNIRPYSNTPTRDLIITALVCLVLGNIGNLLVSTLCGPAPEIYNTVLTALGNIRLSNELHPLFGFLAVRFGY